MIVDPNCNECKGSGKIDEYCVVCEQWEPNTCGNCPQLIDCPGCDVAAEQILTQLEKELDWEEWVEEDMTEEWQELMEDSGPFLAYI